MVFCILKPIYYKLFPANNHIGMKKSWMLELYLSFPCGPISGGKNVVSWWCLEEMCCD
uniref:Uncharacterized protein n=1 Tax=Anguilla anguilla TaxID=7936 RepID=A0A0E9WKL8_ANGAN